MRALLLAAGRGSRLRPLTDSVPKCLVSIRGRVLLDIWLDLLLGDGAVDRVLINTHHLAPAVRSHVAGSHWQSRIDLVHEPILLGTGGTLRANRAYFDTDPVLVAHADNLSDLDLPAFAAAHAGRRSGCAMSMLTFRTDAPRNCGIVEADGAGVVHCFHEKVASPPGNLANGAVYLLTREVLDFVAGLPGRVVDLSTEVIPAFLGRIQSVETRRYHRDIGTQEGLRRATAEYSGA